MTGEVGQPAQLSAQTIELTGKESPNGPEKYANTVEYLSEKKTKHAKSLP